MHTYRRARIPLACLPAPLNRPDSTDHESLDPCRECDVTVDGSRIISVVPSAAAPTGAAGGIGVTDLGGVLTLPGLLEVHTHLDKCHTWKRSPAPHSDFWESLHILGADSKRWTEEDVYRRADFGLRTAWAHGTNALRTHLDTGLHVGAGSHAAVQRLRSEWAGRIEIQTISLFGLTAFTGAQAAHIVELSGRHKATALGGFPQPNPNLAAEMDNIMAAACELGIGLDFHVDESGLVEAECLRAVAEAVLRNEFPHPVACGHNCSLAVQDPARAASTIDLVKEAGIGIISLPITNTHLMGRTRGPVPEGKAFGAPRTPRWRGLTLLHECVEAGVTIACGGDNVRDAFISFGDFDAVELYVQSVRLAHLDTRLMLSPSVVTTGPAAIMGLPTHGLIAPGSPADMIVFPVRDLLELISRPYSARRLIQGETFREVALPDYREQDTWPVAK